MAQKNHFDLLGIDPNEPLVSADITTKFEDARSKNTNMKQLSKQARDNNELALRTARDELLRFAADDAAKQKYIADNQIKLNNNLVNQNAPTRNAQQQAGQNNGNSPSPAKSKAQSTIDNFTTQKKMEDEKKTDRMNPADDLMFYCFLEVGVYKRNLIFPDPNSKFGGFENMNTEEFVLSSNHRNEFNDLVSAYEQRGELKDVVRDANGDIVKFEYAQPGVKQRFEAEARQFQATPQQIQAAQQNAQQNAQQQALTQQQQQPTHQANGAPRLGIRAS